MTRTKSRKQLHATCVAIGGRGVLLLGDSGSGKSDLALRLIDGGAKLVADDQVIIFSSPRRGEAGKGAPRGRTSALYRGCPHPNPPPMGEGELIATAPDNIRGLLEVRGVGIITVPCRKKVPLKLAVSLAPRAGIERLPEPAFWSCSGVKLPLLSLHAFDHSTPAKIRLFVETL